MVIIFQKNNVLALLVIVLSLVCFGGCNGIVTGDATHSNNVATESSDTSTPDPSLISPTLPTTTPTSQAKNHDNFSFKSLDGLVFLFGGASGRGTVVTMKSDGSFDGTYTSLKDGGISESGGIFSGQFTDLNQIDDYTYSMRLDRLEILRGDAGTGGVDGFADAEIFMIYLPESYMPDLPEWFLYWIGMSETDNTSLPFYGLYNVGGEEGFLDVSDVEGFKNNIHASGSAAKYDYSNFIGEWTCEFPASAHGILLSIDSVEDNSEMSITTYDISLYENLMIVDNKIQFKDINMSRHHNSDSYLVELTFYDNYILATVYSKERYISDDYKKVSELENYVDQYRLTSSLVEKDNVVQNNINENTEASISITPNESYVGAWHTDKYKLDDLMIYEISNNTIVFEMGIFRITSLYAASNIENGKVRFGENISLNYSGPTLNGTLEFYDGSVSVTINESESEYMKAGTIYNFTVKDENFIHPEFEALKLVKNYIENGRDSIFEPLISSYPLTYKFKNSNHMIQYDSKLDNGHHLIHQYEIVIDDPVSGESHGATSNWYDVDIHTGKISPMFNDDVSLNENY